MGVVVEVKLKIIPNRLVKRNFEYLSERGMLAEFER